MMTMFFKFDDVRGSTAMFRNYANDIDDRKSH